MNLDFSTILESLGPDAAFRIANSARPAGDYLFETLLPERNVWDYTVNSNNLTVRTTMAGLAALDSPYPPGGIVETSKFLAEVAKIANEVELNEYTIRQLQMMMLQANNQQLANESLAQEVLNFLDKVIIQAHMDTMEWLRGQALVFGAIDWTFGKLNLNVDYGVPLANFLTPRTAGGGGAYDEADSEFWSDVRLIQSTLRWDVRAIIAHPDTIYAILNNDANKAEVLQQNGVFTLRRLIGDNDRPATDTRETITLVPYGLEADVLDIANPGQVTSVPFMPRGKLLGVGRGVQTSYRVGMGSTLEDPELTGVLGYTHIGPTVEGGGRAGRWAELYVPENYRMKLRGRGVTNGLPVIETPQRIVVATSDLDSIGVTWP